MKPFGVIGINAVDQMWSFNMDPGNQARQQGRRPDQWLDGFAQQAFADDQPRLRPRGEPVNTIEVFVDGRQIAVSENEAGDFDDGQVVYFTNTLEDAQRLAEFLAKRNVINKYMTFSTRQLYHAPPGEVQRAEFNEKGLLPT